jgi:hypothetical protein
MRQSRIGFMHQQGFLQSDARSARYAAAMFQPRAVTALVVLGMLLQSPWLFLTLSAVLLWNAVVPAHNVFDAIYDRIVPARDGRGRLGPAPAPRRFAQGLAAAFAFVVAMAIFSGADKLAWAVEVFLVAAAMAVVFLRFCLGSYLYRLLTRSRSNSRPDVVAVGAHQYLFARAARRPHDLRGVTTRTVVERCEVALQRVQHLTHRA